MALAYLAPLPIMIATLGWGLDAGAIAGGDFGRCARRARRAVVRIGVRRLRRRSRMGLGRVRGHAARAILRRAKPDAPVHPSVGAIVSLAALFGMLGSAAVLTTVIVLYGGYREGARQVAEAVAALAADAFDGAPGQPDRARIRRDARALWPAGDRRLDDADAVRQPLCGGALDPAVASPCAGHGRTCRPRSPSLAARRRCSSPASAALTRCPLQPRQYFSDRRGRLRRRFASCRVSRSPTRCRAASRCGRLCWLRLYACCVLRAQIHPSRPRGARRRRRLRKLRARAALLPAPNPTAHK